MMHACTVISHALISFFLLIQIATLIGRLDESTTTHMETEKMVL
jgi:hypothetical protein